MDSYEERKKNPACRNSLQKRKFFNKLSRRRSNACIYRRNSLQKRKFFNWADDDIYIYNSFVVVIPFKNGNSSTVMEQIIRKEMLKRVVIPFKNGNSSTLATTALPYMAVSCRNSLQKRKFFNQAGW